MSYDPIALRKAFQALAPGDARLRAMAMACAEAERAQDPETALSFHHALIKESVFSGDRYQALIDFPRYRALLADHPNLAPAYANQTLWLFKWVVEAAVEFPQIPKEQVLEWFAAFRKCCICAGASLKPFYDKRAMFYRYYSIPKLRLDYEAFCNAPTDAFSDGEADAWSTVVRWELLLGHRDKATDAMTYICKHHLCSTEVPSHTYGYWLADCMARDAWTEAESYAARLRPSCTGNRYQLEQLGLLFAYDAHRVDARALAFYQQQRPLREGSRNPFLCFWFDRGAALLLQAAADAGLSPTAQQEANAAAASCRALAARFDARNGSDYFASQCPTTKEDTP